MTTPRVERMVTLSEDDGDHAWLKVLKGSKAGLQFAVPREQVSEYSEGDEFRATFESQNERNTKWHVDEAVSE